jgi:phosphoribosylformimino-5-aminoimidazole carboxamide ribotide isomerase
MKEIANATGLKVQVGGGVRSTGDVEKLLSIGADRVVVGTKAIEDWEWFKKLVPGFAGKITLALDAKGGMVATHAWTQTTGRMATEIAREVSDWALAGILYTDVAKDGMMGGPNVEATAALARAGKVPVCASGGVGNIGHIRELLGRGLWGVIVGRSLHEGKLDLAEAVKVARG